MAQLLKYDGGTDYTDVGVLSSAVKCYKCETGSVLKNLELNAWLDEAVVKGMPAVTISSLTAALKCWQCLDEQTVKAAYTFLLRALIAKL
jgi:hypothetical protein